MLASSDSHPSSSAITILISKKSVWMPTSGHSDSLELLVAGSNSHGQLGLGHTDDVHHFTLAQRWPASTQILSFAAGARHSLLLIQTVSDKAIGSRTLLGSGDHSNDQLPASPSQPDGLARASTRFTEISYRVLVSRIQSIDNTLRTKLLTAYQPTKVGSSWETSFIVLAPSEEQQSVQTDSSVVLALGSDDFGLRGVRSSLCNTSEPNLVDFEKDAQFVMSISNLVAGPKHVVAVVSFRHRDSNNVNVKVIGWGAARHGQLGNLLDPSQKLGKALPPTRIPIPFELPQDPESVKVGVGKEHTIILCPGHICSLGRRNYAQNVVLDPNLETQAFAVQCCWNTTFLLKQPDTKVHPAIHRLIGFGNNSQAQLGSLDANIRVLEHSLCGVGPVRLAVGSEHVLVSDRANVVYGWGWNEHGNLGLPPPNGPDPSKDARRVIWTAVNGQEVVNLFAGCATSFLCIQKSVSE